MPETSSHPYGPDRERQLAHLASSVGHHVINAYSAIVSNAEILRYNTVEENSANLGSLTDVIINAAFQASAVARRMIDFTRPSTMPIDAVVDPMEIVRAAVEAQAPSTRGRVEWAVRPGPPREMPGDREQLEAMFSYLLLNAVEALPISGGTVTVRSMNERNDWATILIEDDGQGMDASVQERAIEPFFTTKAGHIGIGLCLANSIWRRHAGAFAIWSQPDRGTRIRLTYGLRD